jgi:hypothetical protein
MEMISFWLLLSPLLTVPEEDAVPSFCDNAAK